MKDTLPVRVRFGPFELDLRAGELYQPGEAENGRRTLLSEQPFRVLQMLVEREGAMVSREEIKKKFWPNDTIVEFEHSIHVAIGKLRKAMGDSADEPRYIETIPRRGYRLMVPVEWISAVEDSPAEVGVDVAVGAAVRMQPQPGVLTGRTVSHYRVLQVIGGGGMGVVYRAEDLKLGRRVALKFLPEELGSDPRALGRFTREARAASSLDHPNICAIHEFGDHEGRPFIVMQLLEGQTLRDRLAAVEGALPLEELLDIALQICDGLRAAHERGIIHRDIKPANIFLTDKGVCKILDFGLAKLLEGGHVEEEAAPSPGVAGVAPSMASSPLTLTRTGLAMGTASYMSPEQVRGEKLDARTDLFSFGLVLYEMTTGQRAFTGDTAEVVHDAILNNSPVPARELNSLLPTKLVTTIDKALEKGREKRYQSVSQIQADLRAIGGHGLRLSGVRRWTATGIAVITLFIVGWFGLRSMRPHMDPVKELRVQQLTPSSADSDVLDEIALSPDGKYLAYSDRVGGLSLLEIDHGESRSLPNAKGFAPLSWFPDGERMFASKLGAEGTWIISARDGSKRKFLEEAINPTPSPDGQQFLFGDGNEIWLLSADGHSRHKVLSLDPPWSITSLDWSPTGRRIVFEKIRSVQADMSKVWNNPFEVVLETCDLDGVCVTAFSSPRLHLEANFSSTVWLADRRIVFSLRERPPNEQSSNLWSLEVDPDSGRVLGETKRLTNWSGFEQSDLTASSDGKRLAFQQLHIESTLQLASLDADRGQLGTAHSLNPDTWYSRPAGWTSDSQAALFIASRYGKNGVFLQKLQDRTPQTLVSGLGTYDPAVLSPDGRWLLYTEHGVDGSSRLLRLSLDGGPPSLVLNGDYGYRCAALPSTLCVLSELKGNQVVFSLLDPFKGRGRGLTSATVKAFDLLTYAWDLSPNGTKIALVDTGSAGGVRILDLEHGGTTVLQLTGWNDLQSINWSADGRHLYVSGGRSYSAGFTEWGILQSDLSGKFKVLTEVPNSRGWVAHAFPSRDGRRLMYTQWNMSESVVMLENF